MFKRANCSLLKVRAYREYESQRKRASGIRRYIRVIEFYENGSNGL
jgi:hypothetical protein